MEGGLSKRILVFWETAAILIGGIVGGMADPYPDVVLVSDPLGGGLFAGSLLLPLAAPSL